MVKKYVFYREEKKLFIKPFKPIQVRDLKEEISATEIKILLDQINKANPYRRSQPAIWYEMMISKLLKRNSRLEQENQDLRKAGPRV